MNQYLAEIPGAPTQPAGEMTLPQALDRAGRVRLVKFLTVFGVGGTEKQVVNLARRLDRGRFDLSFACTNRWGELISELEGRRGIRITEYPMTSFFELNALRQQLRFAGALRREQAKIVHSYNFYGNMFAIPAAKLAGVPVVVASIRDMGVYLSPAKLKAHRWVCKLADRVVVNAGAIRDWLVEQGFPEHKLVVIRNGVDTSRFRPRNDGAALRREFDIPPGAPLVVMLARLNPSKGIDVFFQAAARIRARHPEAYFLAVGECYTKGVQGEFAVDTQYRLGLQREMESLGLGDRFRFTGLRKDVPEILAAAAVSVLPSLSEGISNTLLESMAAGVPVVATRVGGTPEVIRDGENGLLIPPSDPQALADAVCRVLDDPQLADRLGRAGRERAMSEFSFEAVVRRTEDLYRELLAEKRPAQRT